MGRKSKTQRLNVWMNGEKVGQWMVSSTAQHEFVYYTSWLTSKHTRPISLSMPLRSEAYKGELVKAYFDNLLPDSDVIRQRIRNRYGISTNGAFDLLAQIGRDCVGALQLLPLDTEPDGIHSIKGQPLTEKEIATYLESSTQFGKNDIDNDFRFSIAGAQEKFALLLHDGIWMRPLETTPTTHILKLPMGWPGQMGIDMSASVENEWLCEKILNAYGIKTASSQIMKFSDKKVLAVERFDRKLAKDGIWLMRLPQEDFCQATGTPSNQKYESDGGPGIVKIMNILLGSSNSVEDRLDFLRTQILFWMLCAIDGHAKNFSIFLTAGGGYHLTPRYDVLSAFPILGKSANQLSPNKAKMAMGFISKSKHYHWEKILPRHIVSTAEKLGLGSDVNGVIFQLAKETDSVINKISNSMPNEFNQHVKNTVLDGLKQQSLKLMTAL